MLVPVEESYTLSNELVLSYSAYFRNMPIRMNHNDSHDWQAGVEGRKVRELLMALANSPSVAEIIPHADDAGDCAPGHYSITLTREDADTSFCLSIQAKGPYEPLHEAFANMLKSFEASTGRPLDPFKLPQ